MDSLEFDHQIFDAREAEAAKNLAVRFFMQPMKDEAASVLEGRPIYNDTKMIEIRVRGDRNNIVVRPVREDDRMRFASAWAAYEKGLAAHGDGTPLAEWPVMSASMVEELRYFGFHTVEQIANASDMVIGKMPGLSAIKDRAKLFLEFSKGAAPLEQQAKRI